MKAYICSSVIIVLGLTSIGRCAESGIVGIGDIPIEYLSECKLKHGIVELPHPGSPKSVQAKGYIFNFTEKQLAIDPLTLEDKEPNSFEEFRQAIIEAKTGDLYFKSGGDDLVLMAVSGRIENLGTKFFYELSGKTLAEPKEAVYTEEGEKLAGILVDVRVGNCYLMSTLEGDLVLFRLISLADDKRSCTIQWVKNAPNAKMFEIPKGPIVQAKKSPGRDRNIQNQVSGSYDIPAVPEFPVDPIEWYKKLDNFQKSIDVHTTNRARLIQVLIDILKKPYDPKAGKTARNVSLGQKRSAIRALAELRAAEAAVVLARNITTPVGFEIFASADTVDNAYGYVPALVKIGKPGAAACIEVIAHLSSSMSEAERSLREKLLCLVILRVEGKDIAPLLLEQRKAETSDAEQIANLDRAIGMLDEVVSWGGVTAPPRPKIEASTLTTEQTTAVQTMPDPTAERGMSPLAHMLIGVALGIIGVGLVLIAKKKLSHR